MSKSVLTFYRCMKGKCVTSTIIVLRHTKLGVVIEAIECFRQRALQITKTQPIEPHHFIGCRRKM